MGEKSFMKDRLFHWPTVARHVLLGMIPFLAAVFLYERLVNEWSLGAVILLAAAAGPFLAIGWLGLQHWKHHRKKIGHG